MVTLPLPARRAIPVRLENSPILNVRQSKMPVTVHPIPNVSRGNTRRQNLSFFRIDSVWIGPYATIHSTKWLHRQRPAIEFVRPAPNAVLRNAKKWRVQRPPIVFACQLISVMKMRWKLVRRLKTCSAFVNARKAFSVTVRPAQRGLFVATTLPKATRLMQQRIVPVNVITVSTATVRLVSLGLYVEPMLLEPTHPIQQRTEPVHVRRVTKQMRMAIV